MRKIFTYGLIILSILLTNCKKEEDDNTPLLTLGALFLSGQNTVTGTTTATGTETSTDSSSTTESYSVSGTITGLSASGLVLQNNSADDLTIVSGATSFTFATSVSSGGAYSVSVKSKPLEQTCTVSNGSGTITADVSNVSVTCTSASLSLSGKVTTIAGQAGTSGLTDGVGTGAVLNLVYSITYNDGFLYFIQPHCVRKYEIATGQVTTLAGGDGSTLGSDDGTGTAARFSSPYGITNDGTNLYITDKGNSAIRKMVIATLDVSTFTGLKGTAGTDDGIGTAARHKDPFGITTDGTYLYNTDWTSHTVRRIQISNTQVTTIAGTAGTSGTDDASGTAAKFNMPIGVVYNNASLFVSDFSNHAIRKIDLTTLAVSTFAGTKGTSGTDDGTGTAAKFNLPYQMVSFGQHFYVADFGNHTIRRIDATTGEVTTVAGLAGTSGTADGTGTAAKFKNPTALATDGTYLYVGDFSNYTLRRIE
ncbi:MAG: hypothetical protein AAF518_24920 [Spirochaetota bacterium]